MKRLSWLGFVFGLSLLAAPAFGQNVPPVDTVTTSRPFTPLHVYYVSPSGNDASDGLTPATAWATPKHKVACGDVLITAAGNYDRGQFGRASLESDYGNFGPVSNCPSTSGGIDGAGGIYFAILLCAGPDVMSCRVNGGSGPAFDIGQGNWAVEGFWATQNKDAERALHDSGGFVVLEALSHGLPVVCLDLGGPRDMVTPSSGVVVKHSGQNSAQLATMMAGQICRLLASPEKLAVLSAGAVARAQDFILAQRIKRFYDRAMEFMPARAHSTEAFHEECSDQTDVPEMAQGGDLGACAKPRQLIQFLSLHNRTRSRGRKAPVLCWGCDWQELVQ